MSIEDEMGPNPSKKGVGRATGFTPGNEVKVDDSDKIHNRNLNTTLRLFDYAVIQSKEISPEEWGKNIDVSVGDISIKITTTPPPRAGGTWAGRPNTAKPTFSKDKAIGVVSEYPDLLQTDEADGKFKVKTKKYLDKDWDTINAKMKEAGMAYSRDVKAWLQT